MLARCRYASVCFPPRINTPYSLLSERSDSHISQPIPRVSSFQLTGHPLFTTRRPTPARTTQRRTRADLPRTGRPPPAAVGPSGRSQRATFERPEPLGRAVATVLLQVSASARGRSRYHRRSGVPGPLSIRPAPLAERPSTPVECRLQATAGNSWSRLRLALHRVVAASCGTGPLGPLVSQGVVLCLQTR